MIACYTGATNNLAMNVGKSILFNVYRLTSNARTHVTAEVTVQDLSIRDDKRKERF